MKKFIIPFISLLIATVTISLVSAQTEQGPHGGRLKQTGSYKIEFIETYSSVSVYLFSNSLKPVSNSGVTCTARFLFKDETFKELQMSSIGDDSFILETFPAGYSACRLTLNVMGKPVSALFENRSVMASDK